MNKTDAQLCKDVVDELASDPAISADDIAVAASQGVVTLSGTVGSYAEKLAAERAVKRVAGCQGMAEHVTIDLPAHHIRNDTDLAKAALHALLWEVTVPVDAITARVENGWISLEGNLEWEFQRQNARRAVEHLAGVRGVYNLIAVEPRIAAEDVKRKLRSTFERSGDDDADRVHIATDGGVVTLSGMVHSWYEHDDAARAAYSIAGVQRVENLTSVS